MRLRQAPHWHASDLLILTAFALLILALLPGGNIILDAIGEALWSLNKTK